MAGDSATATTDTAQRSATSSRCDEIESMLDGGRVVEAIAALERDLPLPVSDTTPPGTAPTTTPIAGTMSTEPRRCSVELHRRAAGLQALAQSLYSSLKADLDSSYPRLDGAEAYDRLVQLQHIDRATAAAVAEAVGDRLAHDAQDASNRGDLEQRDDRWAKARTVNPELNHQPPLASGVALFRAGTDLRDRWTRWWPDLLTLVAALTGYAVVLKVVRRIVMAIGLPTRRFKDKPRWRPWVYLATVLAGLVSFALVLTPLGNHLGWLLVIVLPLFFLLAWVHAGISPEMSLSVPSPNDATEVAAT